MGWENEQRIHTMNERRNRLLNLSYEEGERIASQIEDEVFKAKNPGIDIEPPTPPSEEAQDKVKYCQCKWILAFYWNDQVSLFCFVNIFNRLSKVLGWVEVVVKEDEIYWDSNLQIGKWEYANHGSPCRADQVWQLKEEE